MKHRYQAYGLLIVSETELPGLALAGESMLDTNPVLVRFGPVPAQLSYAPLQVDASFGINERELWHEIPGLVRYYITDGSQIVVESLGAHHDELLLHVYANCLAAILFQRGLIPFHVSGIFLDENRVLLFAAPSQTGKSTLIVKLQERGYPIFTDDTAVLTLEGGQCYAHASYPMARLWQHTIANQSIFKEVAKQFIFAEVDKYGFSFHDQFRSDKVSVAGIVFLDKAGTEPTVELLKPSEVIPYLGHNIYRASWLLSMKQPRRQFHYISAIATAVPAWRAVRSDAVTTFEEFPSFIVSSVINPLVSAHVCVNQSTQSI